MGTDTKSTCRICKTTGRRVNVPVEDIRSSLETLIGTKVTFSDFILDHILNILSLQITLKPLQPEKICEKCNHHLSDTVAFRQMCLQSEMELSDFQVDEEYENYEILEEPDATQAVVKCLEVKEVACQIGEGEYCCAICQKMFTKRNSYDAHLNRRHNMYKQKFYEKKEKPPLSKRARLKAIEEKKSDESTPENVKVEITFITSEEMQRGIVGPSSFQCWICNKLFEIENSYRSHMNRVHGYYVKNQYSLRNPKTPAPKELTYITREELQRGYIGNNQFKCLVCHKKFDLENSFRSHMNRTHGYYVNKPNSLVEEFSRKFPNLKKPLIDFDDDDDGKINKRKQPIKSECDDGGDSVEEGEEEGVIVEALEDLDVSIPEEEEDETMEVLEEEPTSKQVITVHNCSHKGFTNRFQSFDPFWTLSLVGMISK